MCFGVTLVNRSIQRRNAADRRILHVAQEVDCTHKFAMLHQCQAIALAKKYYARSQHSNANFRDKTRRGKTTFNVHEGCKKIQAGMTMQVLAFRGSYVVDRFEGL